MANTNTPADERKNRLSNAARETSAAAGAHQVPEGLLWGMLLTLPQKAGRTFGQYADELAATMAAVHSKTGRWDTAVATASGGKVTDAQATNANNRLPIKPIRESALGVVQGGDVFFTAALTALIAAPFVGGAVAGIVGGGAAAGEGAAAGAGADAAAAGGGAAAGSAASGAASSLLSGLSSKLIAGGIVGALVASVSGYGVRLLEIIAGGLLVLFGLATLAKGSTPNLPAVVPV